MITLFFFLFSAAMFLVLIAFDFMIYQQPATWLIGHLFTPVSASGKWTLLFAYSAGLASAVWNDIRLRR
ncbi:MAG TPA: hypothetical protein VMS09_09165 [Paenibacillus sp.]|uniref:hypothetical protein n=1 Tax=Paenibacillus sp. TaxID=58172 RepID=UPI002CB03E3A|nr:hypothetical protein [Paenibacillus sp.]HUC92183.1 hypothetical protein [Paenibacillus sp.]